MPNGLKFNIADRRYVYRGKKEQKEYSQDELTEFNHRHNIVLKNFGIQLTKLKINTLEDHINGKSNLGVFRNRQLRESVPLAAAIPAIAVGMNGRGELQNYPEGERSKTIQNQLKRDNDRTASQAMAEVLQFTATSLPVGEEVVIQSTITEGVRVKPGLEAGGNPTIAIGALYGKEDHRREYSQRLDPSITKLSMGNDVIDGTGKSITGTHSSLTSLFVTESGVKRHLPDIYVQRWAAGKYFEEFNPRETSDRFVAELMRKAYGFKSFKQLSAFFIDRERHEPVINNLNRMGVSTPLDNDGDLFPNVLLGLEGLESPEGVELNTMMGEIGGSAEWAVGALPLIWRGGQAMGALASHSSLTRRKIDPHILWNERYNYTEDEIMEIHDARFEQKPYFMIDDILERPFAGGVAAFGAITDNYIYPDLKGVSWNSEEKTATAHVLVVNSLGVTEHWEMVFTSSSGIDSLQYRLFAPKIKLFQMDSEEMHSALAKALQNDLDRERIRIMFQNEYYPAMIPIADKMIILNRSINTLMERGVFTEKDEEFVKLIIEMVPEWFMH